MLLKRFQNLQGQLKFEIEIATEKHCLKIANNLINLTTNGKTYWFLLIFLSFFFFFLIIKKILCIPPIFDENKFSN